MNYISTKKASEKWNISTSRIVRLAKSGRIPDAAIVGKSWMIPADAEKPSDARVKEHRIKEHRIKGVGVYRFPLVTNRRSYENKLYTPDEEKFYEAKMLFESGEFELCDKALADLLQNSENRYLKIAVLCYRFRNAIFGGMYRLADSVVRELELIFSVDFPHKEEMKLIYLDVISFLYGADRAREAIRYIPGYKYSPDAEIALGFWSVYAQIVGMSGNFDPMPNLTLYELFCSRLDEAGENECALYCHTYLATLYDFSGEAENSKHHLRKAVDTALYGRMYVTFRYIKNLTGDVFDEVLDEYPEETREKLLCDPAHSVKACLEYLSHRGQTGLYAALTDNDYKYIRYAMKKITNREIAEIEHISEKTVNSNYSKIYEKLSVSRKQELINLYIDTLKNQNL